MPDDKVVVENVNHPGRTRRVDAAKYADMKRALLTALPRDAPGLTQAEMLDAIQPHLSGALFPGGETSGWWMKCVQLDLEAKRVIVREKHDKVLHWRRA